MTSALYSVAEGRPWKKRGRPRKSWPISFEPTTLPSTSILLPFEAFGKSTWATPVVTSG